MHSGSERELKQREREKAKEKGSILTRAGTLEAVFEQGEECSARGRISAGEETGTSAVQGMKRNWKNSVGLKRVRYAGWARAGHNEPIKRGLMRIHFTTTTFPPFFLETRRAAASTSSLQEIAPFRHQSHPRKQMGVRWLSRRCCPWDRCAALLHDVMVMTGPVAG